MEPSKIESYEALTEPQREAAVRLEKLGVRIEVRGEVATGWFRNHCFLIQRSGEVVEL